MELRDAATTIPFDGTIRPSSPFASLNREQRLAVEHGADAQDRTVPGPLLIIAGAGSGKTNTLAHRVAHLVHTGADPQRMLLLTFSRRAAAEMERRARNILGRVLASDARRPAATLAWSGTFHAVGARLLREYADRVGLHDSFTVHDRGDAEDLLALVRHAQGLSSTEQRFPTKSTCLAIYSRAVNSGAPLSEVLEDAFPKFAHWEPELRKLFAAYVGEKQAQNVLDYDDLLLYWSYLLAEPALAREIGARFDHVLVDEYQDTNRLQAAILLAMKPDGAGLTVVGDDAQSIYAFRAATVRNILDFPGTVRAAGARRHARAQLPVDAAHPRRVERGHRARRGAPHQEPVDRPAFVGQAAAGHGARRCRPGALRLRARARVSRERHRAQVAGGAVPQLEPQRAARARADAARDSLREIRRPQVPGGRAHQGRAERAALGGEPAQPHGRLSLPQAARRRRPDHGIEVARRRHGRAAPDAGDAGVRDAAGRRHRLGERFSCFCARSATTRRAGPPTWMW